MQARSAERLELLRQATEPFGAFTAAQARQFGVSRSQLQRYLAAGILLRNVFGRAVYRFDTPAARESLVDAALIAGPEAVASHLTALELHDLTDLVPEADEFTLPRARRSRRPPWPVKFHFTSVPLPSDEVMTVHGVRVTTPARSLVDVARTSGRLDQVERGIAEALERGIATEAAFTAAIERSRLTNERREWLLDALKRARLVSASN